MVDGGYNKDAEGRDLADASKICSEVKRTLTDLVASGRLPLTAVVNVRDHEQRTVVTASISVAVAYPDTHH